MRMVNGSTMTAKSQTQDLSNPLGLDAVTRTSKLMLFFVTISWGQNNRRVHVRRLMCQLLHSVRSYVRRENVQRAQ